MIDLKQILSTKKSVMISAHVSPDADAFCSVLLLSRIIKLNFPDIAIYPILEEKPAQGINYLHEHKIINFGEIPKAIKKQKPDLFILIDCNNFDRITRQDSAEIKAIISQKDIETLIIDHHQDVNRYPAEHYFNRMSPAATLDIYYLAIKEKLDMPPKYQDTLMLGILSDTGRFKYKNRYPIETFELAGKLVDEGVDIEHLSYLSDLKFTEDTMQIIGNLAYNTSAENGYSMSYIDDSFAEILRKRHLNQNVIKAACAHFVDTYSRNIEKNTWGMVIYPELATKGNYSVSFRALGSSKDVSILANKLGGGGHKPAAGAKFIANDITDAVRLVKSVIKD